jgi:thiamine monophosphate synthase
MSLYDVPATSFDLYTAILRETLQSDTIMADSVKDVRMWCQKYSAPIIIAKNI